MSPPDPDLSGAAAHPGHAALALLDGVLGRRPRPDDHALSETVQCLTGFRDAVIAAGHGSGTQAERERLARLNAIIGVVYGARFPLGDVPWDEVEKVRGWLADLVERD